MTIKEKFSEICSFQSINFRNWFGDMEYIDESHILISKTLVKCMTDGEILKEFKPKIVLLGDIYNHIKDMDKDFYAIFYVNDKNGVLRAVGVSWDDDGWDVSANSVEGPGRWVAGDQVFSRNFRESDTLILAIEEVKKAGYVIYKPI